VRKSLQIRLLLSDMEHNLTWLNSKWWYRALKVIYFLSFVVVFGLLVVSGFSGAKPKQVLNEQKSQLTCLEGNHKSYSYLEMDTLTKQMAEADSAVQAGDVANLCGLPNAYGEMASTSLNLPLREQMARKYYDTNNVQVTKWKEEMSRAYTLSIAMKTEGSWWNVLEMIGFAFLIVIIPLEILRQGFYYIVLGTIRPRK